MKKTLFLLGAVLLAGFTGSAQQMSTKQDPRKTANRVQLVSGQNGQALIPSQKALNNAAAIATFDFSANDTSKIKFGLIQTAIDTFPIHSVPENYGNWTWATSDTSMNVTYTRNINSGNKDGSWVSLSLDSTKRTFGSDFTGQGSRFTTANNGFLIISPIETMFTKKFGTHNSYVEFPSINTSGIDVVAIDFEQIYVKFNDKIWLDYSIDGGASWVNKAVPINAENSIGFNDFVTGKKTITLPREAGNQADLKIRFRMYAPKVGQEEIPAFYWAIDDMVIRKANDLDLAFNTQLFNGNFFHSIPKGVHLSEVTWGALFKSTGINNLTKVEGILSFIDDESFLAKTEVIDTAAFLVDTLVKMSSREGNSAPLPSNVVGEYSMVQIIKADNFNYPLEDTVRIDVNYIAEPNPDRVGPIAEGGYGVWARDNGVYIKNRSFRKDFSNGILDDNSPLAFKAKYAVYLPFTTSSTEYESPLYIVGVETYADPVVTKNTAMVMAVLNQYRIDENTDSIFYEGTAKGSPVQVPQKAINVMNDRTVYPAYTLVPLILYYDEAILLEPSKEYWIGYELPYDGQFAVMTSVRAPYLQLPNYGHGLYDIPSYGNILVVTAEQSNGFMWPTPTQAPAIRPILSTNPKLTIKQTPKEIDFKLNCFPNPATDYVNITFSVEETANVTIEILDMTGRVIKTEEMKAMAKENSLKKIDVSGLKSGAYLYTIHVNGLKQTKKFIVTK